MNRTILPVLLALALSAPPAHAQLGIDLSAPPAKKEKKKGKDAKPTRRAKQKRPAPAKPRPAPPTEAPPAPIPTPEEPPRAAPPAEPPLPELAPEPPPPAPAPRKERQQLPGLSLTPLDEKANAEAKARLDAAKKLLDERATETAALAFDQILREPRLVAAHEEARYLRAKALARLGLDHSALAAFDEIIERGPTSRFYDSAMEWVFHVGRRLPNEQPLVARVARHAAKGVPRGQQDRVSYLLSRYEFERGRALAEAGRAAEAKAAWAEARRLAGRVTQDGLLPMPAAAASRTKGGDAGSEAPPAEPGDVVPRARFVEGLVAFAEGNDEAAIEAFKDVVRYTNPRRGRPDPELRELAFLQLARIHYQNRQNRYAIFYYGKMPWGGRRWLEGLWEAAWAHYRIGDYEKSLGNLLTLQSPYFKDEYFPESYVLKAIVYYENCRYPEARQVLEQFSAIYDPLYSELTRVTAAQRTPAAFYDLVRSGGAAGGVARRVLKLAGTDRNIAQLDETISSLEREMDVGLGGRRPEFREAALGKELRARLVAERATLAEEAGQRMRAKLEYERDQLRQLLAQALRIRIEVSRKEREALEGSLAKGSQVEVVRDLKYSYAVSDEHLYWPYEGEFWRDELGTYSYTLTKGCKDRLPRSSTAGR